MSWKNLLLVGLGGMAGSMLRYLFAILIKSSLFPLATFGVNMLGSFLIGLIMGAMSNQLEQADWKLFLASGLCGGFTTFSAFAWENIQFLQAEKYGMLLIYTFGTLLLGILAAGLGFIISK